VAMATRLLICEAKLCVNLRAPLALDHGRAPGGGGPQHTVVCMCFTNTRTLSCPPACTHASLQNNPAPRVQLRCTRVDIGRPAGGGPPIIDDVRPATGRSFAGAVS
jgi:hypothetical protein